jgi:hypothetical protein
MSAYYEAAKRFGGIDPNDKDAVRKFFRDDFHKLSALKQKTIMSFLMSYEGATEQANPSRVIRPRAEHFFVSLERSFRPIAPPVDQLIAQMKAKSA